MLCAKKAIEALIDFYRKLESPITLTEMNIGRDNFQAMAKEALNVIDRTYEKWCKKLGIEYYDMIMYYTLVEYGDTPITQKQICEDMDIPKTTVNSVIKKQIKLGYIELEVNPNNKKEKWIRLTKKGRKYAHDLIDPLFKIEEDSIALLPDKKIQEITKSLSIYYESLKEKLGV